MSIRIKYFLEDAFSLSERQSIQRVIEIVGKRRTLINGQESSLILCRVKTSEVALQNFLKLDSTTICRKMLSLLPYKPII